MSPEAEKIILKTFAAFLTDNGNVFDSSVLMQEYLALANSQNIQCQKTPVGEQDVLP